MVFLSIVAAMALRPAPAPTYEKTWGQIRQAITKGYYARNARGTEMNRLLDKYSEPAQSAHSSAEFEAVVNKMIAEFGDSHFSYLTKSDQNWYMMDSLAHGSEAARMPNFGAWFKLTPAGYEVTMVLEGTPAQKQDLRKGDLVVSVGGKPFTPIDSIADQVDHDVTLTVQRGKTTLSKSVSVTAKPAMTLFLEATEDSTRIVEDNGRTIGYIHLWTMAAESFKSALSGAVYGKLKNTDAMILDLRDGFGGRPEGYGDPFFRPDVELKWVMGDSKTDELFGYGRPLVALVNEGSRSAKEIFSYILKRSKRATLVGHTTAGNVLGTFPQVLADGSIIEIPIADVFADGNRLEGKGVRPDIAVSPEIDSEGKDKILQRALDNLKNVPSSGRFGVQTSQNHVTRKWATANL